MSQNKSLIPLNWINGYEKTPLSEIVKKYQYNMNYETIGQFHQECIQKLNQTYGHTHVEKVSESLRFTPCNGWNHETFVWQMIYNINNILRPFQEKEKKFNEYVEIIKEFHKYGMYKHVNLEFNTYLKSDPNPYSYFDIKKLQQELKELKSAEDDSQKILKDERVMQELLQNPNLLGWIVIRNKDDPTKDYSINITQAAKNLIQPEIDRRIMQRKIDIEARKRIYEIEKSRKEEEEKQKFENAVLKRMHELGFKNTRTQIL